MSAVVSKSSPVVVRPSVPPVMTTGTVNLSPFDKGLDAMEATFFFLFDHPIHEPAETIKRALSQALVHYYPIAGRLARRADADGELCIQCTGEGVAFVAASANCTLEEANFFDQQSLGAPVKLLDELAAVYPAEGRGGHDDPLLLMQVTEFSCGGFVVGVTWNHAVADGAGMAQFLQAVGELARGGLSAPTVFPVRSDDSLPSLPPLVSVGRQMLARLEPRDLACFDAIVPRSLIDRIRYEFCDRFGGRRCTVFEAVTAVVWQCRTRAVAADHPGAPALLSFVANVRKHVGAKDGYYGNCVTVQLVTATCGAVANGHIVDLVEMIKRGKEQIPEQLKQGGGGGLQMVQQVIALASQGLGLQQVMTLAIQGLGQQQLSLSDLFRYSVLSVSCMRNLGLEEADFGGGRPARVMCRAPQMALPDCVVCLPRRGEEDHGASVLLRCVREEHVQAFRGELMNLVP